MITQRMFSGFARRVADPDVPSRATASGGGESPMFLDTKGIVRRLSERFGIDVGLKLWTS